MKQLLIIEDDEINCILFEEILNNPGLNIHFAKDGQQGINKFKENSYDLILLDLGLPKIGGLQVARLIREYERTENLKNKTPIIIITANNSPGNQNAAFDAGADGYLTKPYDIDHLQLMVDTYLKKSEVT